jgi:glycosyltransferase involved in cell wall biosynthesis
MISVLIPVYNTDVRCLVQNLDVQFKEASIPYEIILVDDCSTDAFIALNSPLSSLDQVKLIKSQVNKGRIETRRTLAKEAKFSWLLFIDADSKIIKEDFVRTYIEFCIKEASIITGGRVYTSEPPEDSAFILHWKYGSQREKRAQAVSKDKPYIHFMSNNFLIKKDVFQTLNFEIGFKSYGHEDTWMGIQLERNCIPILHIDNPVLHSCLDCNDTFLKKSIDALFSIKTLATLVDPVVLARHIKIYRFFRLIRFLGLGKVYKLLYKIFKKRIESKLTSREGTLIYFDLYRLRKLQDII